MKITAFYYAGVITACMLVGSGASALADAPSAVFAGKPLPWPAASRAASAVPPRFFPLSAASVRQRPPARTAAHDAPPKRPASSAPDVVMTEEQARQLLSVYPVHP